MRKSRKRVSRKRVSRKRVSRRRHYRMHSRGKQPKPPTRTTRRGWWDPKSVAHEERLNVPDWEGLPLTIYDPETGLRRDELIQVFDLRDDETNIRRYKPHISISGLDHCAKFTDPKSCAAINPDRRLGGDLYSGDCYWDFDKKWCRNIEKRWAKEKPWIKEHSGDIHLYLNPRYEGLTYSHIKQMIRERDDEMRERAGVMPEVTRIRERSRSPLITPRSTAVGYCNVQ